MPRTLVVDLLGYTGGRGGTETYSREIVERLPRLMPGTRLIGLTSPAGAEHVRQFFPGELRITGGGNGSPASWAVAEVFRAERVARARGGTALWTPANFGPIRRGMPRVVTIHDLIYHQVPGSLRERPFRRATAELMARSARTADAVIAVSEATAEEVRRRLRLPAERIHVIPNGASPAPSAQDGAREAGPDGRSLVLSTGNRMSHKNHVGLLEAIARIEPASRPLVVITGGGPHDPLAEHVTRLGLDADVDLPGWVSSDALEALYARASVYVCPSLLEGFGLPVVDALARGCVVVANDIPVLREVGGDATIYADATDPSALARAITSALESPEHEARRRRGREWAARFTWDAAAESTASVLTRTLDADRPRPTNQRHGGRR